MALLAAAPAIPAVTKDVSGVVNNLVWSLTSRPEIIAMLLGSIPMIALMPYIAMLIQWNLEHLEFYYEGSYVTEKYWADEVYHTTEARIIGDRIVEAKVTNTRKVLKSRQIWSPTGKTSIRRLEHPQNFVGHSLAPPMLSNAMETAEMAQSTLHEAFKTTSAGLQGTTDLMEMVGNLLKGLGLQTG